MKTARKALVLAACAIMLVCATIAGTLAYLTATDSVKNTFTVGDVNITMDEAKVTTDGKYVTDVNNRTDNNAYKLLPGKNYIKDPTIKVTEGSEDCYLFVKVENGISDIEAAGTTTIANQMTDNGWTQIGDSNIYYYNKKTAQDNTDDTVSAGTSVVVFNNFTISDTVESDVLASYAPVEGEEDSGAKIIVTAYAIQADGFDTAEEAWEDAGAQAQGQGQAAA